MKRFVATLSLLAVAFGAMADNISETEARNIAAKFLNSSATAKQAKAANASLTLSRQSTGYFVFSRGTDGGFVVVAADDNASDEVLGYADSGTIDADHMPDNLQWWLDEYDRQMTYLSKQPQKQVAKASKAAIAPMVTTLWDQGEPYYNLCPTYNGETCYTGCVATALAQIMRYHRWPEKGTGSISYDWRVNNRKVKTITADFSQSTYDWDNMTDTYNSASTTAQQTAVARLMYDVGAGAQMAYSPDGSGAYSIDAAAGLVKYFGYDKGISYVQRNYFTHDEWYDMIYGELAEGRPVYASGYDAGITSGHAFVFDGYQNGYFHVNWGWSGTSNGYFLLSALTPDVQGSGGGGESYSYQLEALTGIRKAQSGSDYNPFIFVSGDFYTYNSTVTRNSTVYFYGNTYYYGVVTGNLNLGLKWEDTNGNVTYCKGAAWKPDAAEGYSYFTMNSGNFPTTAGTYKVTPAAYDNDRGEWLDIRTAKTGDVQTYISVTYKNSVYTFSNTSSSSSSATLTATDLTASSKIYAGKTVKATANITAANADYYGNTNIAFMKATATTPSVYGSDKNLIDLADGESQEQTLWGTAPSTAGTYYMVVVDDDRNIISPKVEVTVNAVPTSSLALTLTKKLNMGGTTGVDPNNIRITANVKCSGGFYDSYFLLYFFKSGDQSSSIYLLSPTTIMGAGDTQTVVFEGALPSLKPSTSYTAYACYIDADGNSQYFTPYNYNQISFTTAATSGIADTKANGTQQPVRIYSLSGVLLDSQQGTKADLSRLPKGVYIVKTGKETKKIKN